VSPVRYRLGFFIAEDGILHSHRCGNLISYKSYVVAGLLKCSPLLSRVDVSVVEIVSGPHQRNHSGI
jgi:hypothetical protein